MRLLLKENKLLISIICIALIVSFVVIGGRFQVELNNKKYDIVLDYNEIEAMAEQSEHDISWWLLQFKEMGITKVGLSEENMFSLMEGTDMPVSAVVMDIVMRDADWEANYPDFFINAINDRNYDKYDLLVETASKEAYEFISEAMRNRYQPEQYLLVPGEESGYILLDGNAKQTLYSEKYKYLNSLKKGFTEKDEIVSSKIMYLNLGMLDSKVQIIKDAGMEIIPRTASYEGWNDTKYAEAVIDSYKKLGTSLEYMIVGGESVIGYDDGIETAQNFVRQNNVTLGMIENTTQLQNILQFGVNEIVQNTGYDAVRIFSVWDYIQNRYQYYGYEGAKEIENTLFRAIVERNIRVIYFKPIKEFKDQHVYVTDVLEYKTMFSNLENRLKEHNIVPGQASVMDPYNVQTLLKLVMAIGCVAAAILLIRTILPIGKKIKSGLLILGVLGVLGAFYIMPDFSEVITAFAASVIFPCLATVFMVKQSRYYSDALGRNVKLTKIVALSVGTLIIAVLISLMGAMMTAAPISSINYMLEINIFRGVKLAQLLPLAFFALVYLAYFGYGENKQYKGVLEYKDLKDLFNADIKVWMILLAAVLGGLGAYYIIRTGHDSSLQVSSLEMIFRNTLEDNLMARPRTKEFLFAFPAVIMLLYTSVRGFKLWPIIFGLASVIGMTSVVNTFMHIRTPLYLGFIRTGYSLLFGIIIGIILVFIFEAGHSLFKKLERQIV